MLAAAPSPIVLLFLVALLAVGASKCVRERKLRGKLLGCSVCVLACLIGFAIMWPGYYHAGSTARKNACIANLRQIDDAKEQWALKNKLTIGTAADTIAVNGYLKNSQAPACPAGGTYTYGAIGVHPTCSMGPSAGHTL